MILNQLSARKAETNGYALRKCDRAMLNHPHYSDLRDGTQVARCRLPWRERGGHGHLHPRALQSSSSIFFRYGEEWASNFALAASELDSFTVSVYVPCRFFYALRTGPNATAEPRKKTEADRSPRALA